MAAIYILTHEFRPVHGGAGAVCEKLAITLARLGHEVEVWGPEYLSELKGESGLEFRLRPVRGVKGTRNLGCLWAMAKELWRHRSQLRDATLYFGEPGPIAVFFFLSLLPVKWGQCRVATLHGSEIERYHRHFWNRRRFRRFLKHMDRVHVLSSFNEQKLTQLFPESQSKLVRGFGMHVPGESLPPVPVRDDHARPIRVLSVGRIHPRKGQLELLEAAMALPETLQRQIELRFAGQFIKGTYLKKLKRLAEFAVFDVHFLGGISDETLRLEYEKAQVFALTSIPYQASIEGLGLVYLEASRFALPILAHWTGGVGDVVVDGVPSPGTIDSRTTTP